MTTLSSPDTDYRSLRSDVERWRAPVAEVLQRHGLPAFADPPVAGFNPTYPTFLVGETVVKFFGHLADAAASHRAERVTLARLATDPQILAPRLLGFGELGERFGTTWGYLIQARVPGTPMGDAGLERSHALALAADLGGQLRRVHALSPEGIASAAERPGIPLEEAATRSSLPDHLVPQVAEFVARLEASAPVLVHGDLVDNHVFVQANQLSGIIDWGDALVTDRYYELGKLFWGTFDGDQELLGEFLGAYEWPRDQDFARNVLGYALKRQATGLAQHLGFDVFHKLPPELRVAGVATLEDLAAGLFQPAT